MMGVDPDERGGIASVVRIYAASGFLDRWSIRYLKSHRDGSTLQKAVTAAGAAVRLLGFAVLGRLALVHVHSSLRSSFARKSFYLAIARAAGATSIFHLHSGEFEIFARRDAGPALRWWIRRTLERSSAVVVLSESWRKTIQGLAPGARISVIPNPVEIPDDEPGPPSGGERRILFLGRADRKKGIFDLVDAVARLAPDFQDLTLVVAGDGNLEALRCHAEAAGIGKRLKTLGWIGPNARGKELRRASAFVLPSFNEGLPLALLEAMAAGRPVVATPVGGIPEAVHNGRDGLLVEPGNVEALAAAIRRLLSDPALCRRLGHQARETVVAGYSTHVVLDLLTRLYEDVGAKRA